MELYLRNDGREYHGNETYKRKKQKTFTTTKTIRGIIQLQFSETKFQQDYRLDHPQSGAVARKKLVNFDPNNYMYRTECGTPPDRHLIVVSLQDLSTAYKQYKGRQLPSFERIIVDEAHNIRFCYQTASGKMLIHLNAPSKFCYTGTPRVNLLTDFRGYVVFLDQPGNSDDPDLDSRIHHEQTTAPRSSVCTDAARSQ
ncbi:hypothetical protein LTR37_019863 [Vermiconidia calcicola]|uniref:Uncharacterized protein n=1 Tax=Vermiconidia calcicola TaxID=1690605 RepID=A0ACC3MEV6_9PEZI|nr:hypothetical protein LTR37_019863 [Vermiconidia calcicola]